MRWLKENTGPNRQQARAAFAQRTGKTKRSYPLLRRSLVVQESEARGRQLIERLVLRGAIVNAKPRPAPKVINMQRVTASVRRAMRGL